MSLFCVVIDHKSYLRKRQCSYYSYDKSTVKKNTHRSITSMADSNDDIDAMLHPPPPPPGINDAPTPNALAPSIGPRQICPAEGVGLVLTPPRELETRRLICRSAVSSLTTRTSSTNTMTENAAVTASAAHTMTPLSGSKCPALDLAPDCSSPSPSKNYPDYSITKSSGDSVASGDDSLQWEIEGDRILAAHTSKMHEEEVDADAELQQENAIAELEEFMLCGGGREDEDEVVAPPVVFETVAFPFKQTTLPTLKDIAKAINVQYTGTKKVIDIPRSNNGTPGIAEGDG